jgi:hypothetical protein
MTVVDGGKSDMTWTEIPLTQQLVAEVTLVGMGFDVLGGCYLAYDLLGGKRGPLRTIARTAGYVACFSLATTSSWAPAMPSSRPREWACC